jgi:hypothetical protein
VSRKVPAVGLGFHESDGIGHDLVLERFNILTNPLNQHLEMRPRNSTATNCKKWKQKNGKKHMEKQIERNKWKVTNSKNQTKKKKKKTHSN